MQLCLIEHWETLLTTRNCDLRFSNLAQRVKKETHWVWNLIYNIISPFGGQIYKGALVEHYKQYHSSHWSKTVVVVNVNSNLKVFFLAFLPRIGVLHRYQILVKLPEGTKWLLIYFAENWMQLMGGSLSETKQTNHNLWGKEGMSS